MTDDTRAVSVPVDDVGDLLVRAGWQQDRDPHWERLAAILPQLAALLAAPPPAREGGTANDLSIELSVIAELIASESANDSNADDSVALRHRSSVIREAITQLSAARRELADTHIKLIAETQQRRKHSNTIRLLQTQSEQAESLLEAERAKVKEFGARLDSALLELAQLRGNG